jgi:hypothetical protein
MAGPKSVRGLQLEATSLLVRVAWSVAFLEDILEVR